MAIFSKLSFQSLTKSGFFDTSISNLLTKLFYGFLTTTAIFYLLFQKKLLPKPISKIVSKLLFLPTFPITALLRIGNYWTTVDDTLILGCAPMNILNHPKLLHQIGVRGVVNMCYEYCGPIDAYNAIGITQLRLPTVDHFEPTVDQMEEAVKFIDSYKKTDEKVYVHCKAGHGRAASIALCWLIKENPNLSPEELNAVLRSKRKVRPTLFKQKNVREFTEKIRGIKSNDSKNE